MTRIDRLTLRDTARGVRLVAASLDLIAAEEQSAAELAAALGVAAPADWPPPLFDARALAWTRTRLEATPDAHGWYSWYVIASIDGRDTLAGIVGYKGPPSQGGVEVGYSVVPAYQRRRIASAAVTLLVTNAFARGVGTVAAETLPDLVASQGVLAACGFVLDSRREEPDQGVVLRYLRPPGRTFPRRGRLKGCPPET